MENKIIKKQMDDDSQGRGMIQKKKNNFAINISKGGGIGIGVGIILVGGALLVNSFQKKPPKKPIKKNHDDHSSTAENTYDQHLISDDAEEPTGSGDSSETSAKKMLQDGNHKFEGSNGKEDHLNCEDDNDDQEITSCAKDSENQTMECNGFVVETERLSSSIITDTLLHQDQLTVSGIGNQETGEEEASVTMLSSNEVNSGLIDDDDDQESGSIADTTKHVQDDDLIALESIEDSKVNEIPEEASEEVDTTMLSSIEVNCDSIDQESDSNADTAKHGEDDELLNLKSIEVAKIYEIPVREDNSKRNAEILVSGNEENVCSHSSVNTNIIKEEEMNGTYEACQYEAEEAKEEQEAEHEVQIDGAGGEIDVQDSSNGLLTTSDVGVSDKSELLEEPKIEEEPETPNFEEKEAEFGAETNAAPELIEENKAQDGALLDAAGEAAEEKEIQHDVQTKEAAEIDSSIEHTSKLIECQVIEEAIEDKEEKEIDVHTNAEREAAEIESKVEHTSKLIECQVIEEPIEDKEEKEAQHDVHINAAGEGEASEINPGSKKSRELETILDQDHNHVGYQITSDNILPQENDQNISLQELTTPPELNPMTGLKIDSKDVGIDLHSIEPVTEKDIICQETDALSQAVIVDNVEESSGGSSVPMQVKDQTEKLQENGEHVTLQKTEKEIHYKEIEDVAFSSENFQTVNIEKEISNTNFFKKYMVKLAEQNDEKKSLLMRKRGPIVIGTISALLWPLCYSYFGLPFLKIFLIAVLVMVLSKIQGF